MHLSIFSVEVGWSGALYYLILTNRLCKVAFIIFRIVIVYRIRVNETFY